MQPFEQITIIGVGLLGGSLGLACKNQGLARRIVGFGRNRSNLEKARQLKVIDEYCTDLSSAVKGADLIVLCSPVGSFKRLVEEMIPFVKPGTILTDVGSVKAPVVEEIESIIPRAIFFVGGHPIAGREKSGVSAAEKDLYRGAKCYVTPTPNTDKAALARVISLWECLGMKVSAMDAEEHDHIFGAVSHLPHVVAYALMNTVAGIKSVKHEQIAVFGGNGLKDITRIAASDPVMWRDICLANKKSVLAGIGLFQEALDKIKAHIEAGEGDALEQVFSMANKHRLSMCENSNDHCN